MTKNAERITESQNARG